MGYDLSVWGVNVPSLEAFLPTDVRWQRTPGGWAHMAARWQVVISDPVAVEPEDVPTSVRTALPNITHSIEMAVEPGHAPKKAYDLLHRVACALAEACGGTIMDGSSDQLVSLETEQPSPSRSTMKSMPILSLSWWCKGYPVHSQATARAFIDVLRGTLPEAVPRRYDRYPPCKHALKKMGLDHLARFMAAQDGATFHCTLPVVDLSIKGHWPDESLGRFEASFVRVMLDQRCLREAGRAQQLHAFWRAMSEHLQPLYGEVRALHGYYFDRGQLSCTAEADDNLNDGKMWRGVPRRLGCAVVAGGNCREVWPQLRERGLTVNNLTYLERSNWTGDVSLSLDVPRDAALCEIRDWNLEA